MHCPRKSAETQRTRGRRRGNAKDGVKTVWVFVPTLSRDGRKQTRRSRRKGSDGTQGEEENNTMGGSITVIIIGEKQQKVTHEYHQIRNTVLFVRVKVSSNRIAD